MTDKPRKKAAEALRSARWFAPDDLRAFGHRSRAMQMGYAPQEWKDRPVIAILNTWSDAQPCHMHFKSRVDDVKRGILMAGGFPIELPALSLSESLLKPTTMLYRNMLAMDAEELLRGHPVDGVVLMGGCDKTTPGLLLGATSMNLPAVYLPAGPMLRGNWKGKTLGSGSDAWKYWDERRAGKISDADWLDMEAGIARSYGTCMTMGTASTMTAIAEAIGMTLPGASSIPAADANRIRMRPPHCRDGVGGLDAEADPDPRGLRKRHCGGNGDGLLDQRDHPSDRAGAPCRSGYRARRFREGEPQGAGDRQRAALGRGISDGGFFLRRRPAGADEPHQGSSASRLPHRHRQDPRREHCASLSL